MILTAIERKLAWRYLRPARREGFVSVITLFSIIGIMLGVATLILVTSLMNGIREEMTSSFIGMDGHISVYARDGFIDSANQSILQAVESTPHVKAVIPKVTGQVMATHAGAAQGAQVLALPADTLAAGKVPLLADKLGEGLIDGLRNGEGVVLGERLARHLRLNIGDPVTLISPEGRATAVGMIPRMKAYPLIGTIKLGMHLYDSSLILIPYDEGRVFFKFLGTDRDGYQKLDVMLDDTDATAATAQALQQTLTALYYVEDFQNGNQTVFQALSVQRNVMVIILLLIVIVAAFNIISSLIMLVQDKGSDIAILRTMGATRRTIMAVFCFSGTLIGLIGTGLGLVLGVLAAANLEAIKQFVEHIIGQEILIEQIYFLSTLPTKTDPGEVIAIVLMAVALSFLATIYPAWRAASINPSEALRYE